MKRSLLVVLALLLVAATVFVVPTVWFQPWSVNHLYTRVFLTFMFRHPQILSGMGILNNVPSGNWRDRLDDYSIHGEDDDIRIAEETLARLHRYDRAKLKPADRLSYDVMDWFVTDMVEGARFRNLDYPINQMYGFQSELPDFMLNVQPLRTKRDAESYLRRVAAFGTAFDQTLERLGDRERHGVVPPRFVLREVREQMERFAARPAAENDLVTHFRAVTDTLKGLDAPTRERLRGELVKTVEQVVRPAYRRMIAFVAGQEQRTTDDDGVWKLPNGAAYYDYELRHYTTSSLPADSIHAVGLREVARLQREMTPLLDRVHVAGSGFGERMDRMRKDPRFGFPPGDPGRAEIMARYDSILADASRRCDSLFDVHPRARPAIERIPAFKEATSPAAYYNPGAFDGSRPGTFYVNLRNPVETRRPDMRTLAYHEGIPGHHFQLSIQQQMKDVPFFRRVLPFTAYAEGWALYAEHLALEDGFHQDAYDSLGAMGAELFRAVRLVVDTGIHRDRWTRRQAIDYMVSNTGMDTAAVTSEVERYIVMPGQACAYKVGQLEILALRQRAEERLGGRFDLRRFHDVVLTSGALPLTLLERVVNDWVDGELQAARVQNKG